MERYRHHLPHRHNHQKMRQHRGWDRPWQVERRGRGRWGSLRWFIQLSLRHQLPPSFPLLLTQVTLRSSPPAKRLVDALFSLGSQLIFTRLATYFTRLSTELFSLGSKLILTRLKTYFHSARHWLAQAYKNKVCPGPRHVGALLDFFWCKDKPLRLTTIWAPCTGGWDALNMVHDAGAGGLHWYSVDPFRFCTGLLNTAPQCSGLVQWPGALTKIHLVHRIGVFTSYLLWFSCAGAVQCCWCTRPLPTPAAPPWGETAPDSTNQWCSHNLKLVLPQ